MHAASAGRLHRVTSRSSHWDASKWHSGKLLTTLLPEMAFGEVADVSLDEALDIPSLPQEHEWIGSTLVDLKTLKTDGDSFWVPRRLVCDREKLMIVKPGGNRVLDVIPLVQCEEIINLEVQDEAHEHATEGPRARLASLSLGQNLDNLKCIECAVCTVQERTAWAKAFRHAAEMNEGRVEGSEGEQTTAKGHSGTGTFDSRPLLTGLVKKKGQVNTRWKDRFFVLQHDGTCNYYASEAHYEASNKHDPSPDRVKGYFACRGLHLIEDAGHSVREGYKFTLFIAKNAHLLEDEKFPRLSSSREATPPHAHSRASLVFSLQTDNNEAQTTTTNEGAERNSKSLKGLSVHSSVTYGFNIKCLENGHNSGRVYTFRQSSKALNSTWVALLKTATRQAKQAALGSHVSRARSQVRRLYASTAAQSFFAIIIFGAFVVSLVDTELHPAVGSDLHDAFNKLEYVFAIVFAVELCVNMFGSWFWDFISSAWNIFDLLVVVISVLGLVVKSIPVISLVRLIRVFRVVKLIRWNPSLRHLIDALVSSIVPVINALVIFLLFTGIYAVICTKLYGQEHAEYFGTVSCSLFTLIQMASGDAWYSQVGRSILTANGVVDKWASIFFASYTMVVGMALLNIIIAVLLSEFMSTIVEEKEQARAMEIERWRASKESAVNPLRPLLMSLLQYSSLSVLDDKIKHVFDFVDTDNSGRVSRTELKDGIRRLNVQPTIYLSDEDWYNMTEQEQLCNSNGELDLRHFSLIMKYQMKQCMLSELANSMNTADALSRSMASVLKLLLCQMDPMQSAPVMNQKYEGSFKTTAKKSMHGLKDTSSAQLDEPSMNESRDDDRYGDDDADDADQWSRSLHTVAPHLSEETSSYDEGDACSDKLSDQENEKRSASRMSMDDEQELQRKLSSMVWSRAGSRAARAETRPDDAVAVEEDGRCGHREFDAKWDQMVLAQEKLARSQDELKAALTHHETMLHQVLSPSLLAAGPPSSLSLLCVDLCGGRAHVGANVLRLLAHVLSYCARVLFSLPSQSLPVSASC
jgi:voltage-gated sodium channel